MRKREWMSLMTLMMLVVASVFSSCEGDKKAEVEGINVSPDVMAVVENLSTEDDQILRLSIDEFLQSAGCELDGNTIKLSPYIQQLMNDNMSPDDQAELFEYYTLVRECIDLNQIYIVIEDINTLDGDDVEFYIYALINDYAKLRETLLGIDEFDARSLVDSEMFLVDGRDALYAHKEKVLFFVISDDIEGEFIRRAKVAQNNPISSVGADIINAFGSDKSLVQYISIANVANYVMEEMDEMSAIYNIQRMLFPQFDFLKSHICSVVGFDGSNFVMNGATYIDGKKCSMLANAPKIDSNALKYLSKEQVMVMATTALAEIDFVTAIKELPDYKLADGQTRAMYNLVATYFNKIDGEVIIAAGPRNQLLSYAEPNAENWSATVMVKFEAGVAQELLDLFYGQMQAAYFPIEMVDNDVVMNISELKATIYAGVRDNYLIVSLNPINEATGCAYDGNRFSDYNTQFIVELEKGNVFMSMLGLDGMSTALEVNDNGTDQKLVWNINNGSKNFVESLIEFAVAIDAVALGDDDYYFDDEF